jgi:hypothetical protein
LTFVEKSFDRSGRDCLFIFGNTGVVPMATYDNPTKGEPGDPDSSEIAMRFLRNGTRKRKGHETRMNADGNRMEYEVAYA